jgi:hypothetical protein
MLDNLLFEHILRLSRIAWNLLELMPKWGGGLKWVWAFNGFGWNGSPQGTFVKLNWRGKADVFRLNNPIIYACTQNLCRLAGMLSE